MCSVLLICTANRCRSPMAEGLFKKEARPARRSGSLADLPPAGHGQNAVCPPRNCPGVMARRKIDWRGTSFAAVGWQTGPLGRCRSGDDTQSPRGAAGRVPPEVADRIYLISQLTDRVFDIEDPYGGSLDEYEVCANDLQRILTEGWAHLVELAIGCLTGRAEHRGDRCISVSGQMIGFLPELIETLAHDRRTNRQSRSKPARDQRMPEPASRARNCLQALSTMPLPMGKPSSRISRYCMRR